MSDQPAKVVNAVMKGQLKINDFHDTDNSFLNTLYSQMNSNNLIGSGGVGKVYLVGKYVIKEATPCLSNLPQLKPYCNDLKTLVEGNPLVIIPYGKKNRYILPNLLSEGIIGMFFKESEISIHLSGILGTFILVNKGEPSLYFVMERYFPIFQNKLNSMFTHPLHYLYLLFQVSSGLLESQQNFRFTHYDLHLDNVLVDSWPENIEYLEYSLPNSAKIQIPKKYCPFIAKITDYGTSRLETIDALVTPSVYSYPDATFGEFNPSYDIISFVGSTLFHYRTSHIFRPLLHSNLEFYMVLLNFVLWMFNDSNINLRSKELSELQRVSKVIGEKYYKKDSQGNVYFRPISTQGNLVNFTNTKSMTEIVIYLANMMEKLGMTSSENKNVLKLPSSKKYIQYDTITPFTTTLKSPPFPKIGEVTSTNISMDIQPSYINVKTYRVLYSSPPNDFNFIISPKQIESCPYQEHYITAITVNKNTFGYSFSSECCMLDPSNYLRLNNFTGFTINGGFFNIGKDYLPIGPYRDQTSNFNKYPIPEKYKDSYGYIAMRGNELIITRDMNDTSNFEFVFSTGPILIEKGEIVFNPYQEKFACVDPNQLIDPVKVISEKDVSVTISGYFDYSADNGKCTRKYVDSPKTFPNCNKIKAGDLSHSDNPNPRSAICILKNGDYIFLTIEGREERGVGIDLKALSSSIIKNFPNVQTAINLDGGRSSNMAWRTSDNPNNVYISNPNHMYQYPVGNILTFKKKK